MKNIWIWLVVLVVIIGGGYWYWQSTSMPAVDQTPPPVSDQAQNPSTTDQTPPSTSAPMTATVTYNGSSFSPSTVTIAKGGTVTFTSTGSNMWVASDPHPTHQGYSGTTRSQHCPDTAGTAFDQCAPGGSYSFTFQKTGSWGYHDHLNDNVGGTVIVQ